MRALGVVLLSLLTLTGTRADQRTLNLGGDIFTSGSTVSVDAPSPRDMLATGFSVEAGAKVEGDLQAMGFSVDVEGPVGSDLYACGFSLDISAPIGADLTAMTANLNLGKAAAVAGNARIFAGSATVDAPIAGSLLATAGSLELNGTVAGDVRLTSGHIAFGPDAKIGGVLTYISSEPIDVPITVASADRVHFEKLAVGGMMDGFGDHMRPWGRFWPSAVSLFAGFGLTIAFLLAVAAVLYLFAPHRAEELRKEASEHPTRSLLLGALGMAMLVGLVPVSAITLLGIPLIPVVILTILLAWIVGYLLGVYAVSWRVSGAFLGTPDTGLKHLAILALGLVLFALLNFIPVIGWLVNLLAVFLGLGALVQRGAILISDRAQKPSEAGAVGTADVDHRQ